MVEMLLGGIAGLLILSSLISYRRTKDPLSPILFFAPMLAYVYVYRPMSLHLSGEIYRYYSVSNLEYALTVNLVFLFAFVLGVNFLPSRNYQSSHFNLLRFGNSEKLAKKAILIGTITGTVAVFVFWSSVWYSGGPVAVFSQRKPFLVSPIGSGYYSDLELLAYPAVLFLAIGWQGQKLTIYRLLGVLLVASPHLMMGTLGGRRGPAFLIVGTLVVAWLIFRRKAIDYRRVLMGLVFTGLFLIALNELRGDLFRIGFQNDAINVVADTLSGKRADAGDECIYSVAQILVSDTYDLFFWGRRYFGLFFVRPIPRFLWPTKYEDVGLDWMVHSPGSLGISRVDWASAIGFVVPLGTSGGFISDLYIEFWWFGAAACFALGWFFEWMRQQSLKHGGFWTILFFMTIVLSVYLPSQNFEAWGYRMLIFGVVIVGFWKYGIERIWQEAQMQSYYYYHSRFG